MTIEELLRRQAGVITRAQATGAGISLRTVQRRVACGAWSEVRPGVYLVGGHRLTDEVRVRSAWLWAGPGSLVAGPAAAYWHGLPVRPLPAVDLAVPPGFRRRVPPGIRARRRTVPDADRSVLRGIGVTGLGLTVLDTVAVLPDAATFLDRALQRHLSFTELHAAYCRAVGTHGMARAGDLLVVAADRADSALERRLVRLLRAAGIDGFVRGLAFGGREIDLAFPRARLAVEVDGWAWHSDRPLPRRPGRGQRPRRGRLDAAPVHVARHHRVPGRDRGPRQERARPGNMISATGRNATLVSPPRRSR